MDKKTQNLMFSSKTDEWETPETIFNKLNQRYKFTLDPCASVHNAKCTKYFTKEDDGLTKSWKDQVVFVNPPYSNVKEWVAKSHLMVPLASCSSLQEPTQDTGTTILCQGQIRFTLLRED